MVNVGSLNFEETLEPGRIYFFKNKELTSDAPHFHILIAIPNNDLLILTCCTSQFEKRARFIELANLPNETLVWLKPDDDNPFTKDTYVDCNSSFKYSRDTFIDMYTNENLEYKGIISDGKLLEIIHGVITSPMITEEIKDLITED
jgi:hypothetical protein